MSESQSVKDWSCANKYLRKIKANLRTKVGIPIKDDSRWKLSQELKRQIPATFFAKYTCVEMASRKIQAYQN